MKRMITLLLSAALCVFLCSCMPLSRLDTISYNDEYTELYYNGYTYVNYDNTNGKYRIDLDDDTDNWVRIATMPYGFFYILGAVTVYYGNHTEKPDFITNSRTYDFYVREDVTIDHHSMVTICDVDVPIRFNIENVTTGNVIAYDYENPLVCKEICNFFVAFEDYPGVRLWIDIFEYNGKLYLQDVWNSDYYEITEKFKEDLYKYGINTFDYH